MAVARTAAPHMNRSTLRQRLTASAADDGVSFDLDLPAGIEQPSDDDHGGCRANRTEQLPMHSADRAGVR